MGSVTSYKIKRVSNFLNKKLAVVWSKGSEMTGWYYLDGRKVLRVTVPHQHGGGSGDSITQRVFSDLKNQLKTTRQEFDDLYNCPMSGSEYEAKIRSMGIV